MSKPETIDEYTLLFPPDVQEILNQVRAAIHNVAPEATEAISYAIPTFRVNGKNIVHYGAYPHHIGFYATPDGHAEFEPELATYRRGKGSVQFPLDQPMPLDLIKRITVYRVNEAKQ